MLFDEFLVDQNVYQFFVGVLWLESEALGCVCFVVQSRGKRRNRNFLAELAVQPPAALASL